MVSGTEGDSRAGSPSSSSQRRRTRKGPAALAAARWGCEMSHAGMPSAEGASDGEISPSLRCRSASCAAREAKSGALGDDVAGGDDEDMHKATTNAFGVRRGGRQELIRCSE